MKLITPITIFLPLLGLIYWITEGGWVFIIFAIVITLLETLNWHTKAKWIFDSYWQRKIFRGMTATTFGKYIVTKHTSLYWAKHYYYLERVERHEYVHVQQYAQWSVIGFLLIYSINFIINLIWYRDFRKAYRNILFERQARKEANQ